MTPRLAASDTDDLPRRGPRREGLSHGLRIDPELVAPRATRDRALAARRHPRLAIEDLCGGLFRFRRTPHPNPNDDHDQHRPPHTTRGIPAAPRRRVGELHPRIRRAWPSG